jgi:hypothetical protein
MAGNTHGAGEVWVFGDFKRPHRLLWGYYRSKSLDNLPEEAIYTVENIRMRLVLPVRVVNQRSKLVRIINQMYDAIADYLPRNTESLKRLCLNRGDRRHIPINTALVQALKSHPSLEILMLFPYNIEEVDVRALSAISSNTTLKALHVYVQGFSDNGMVALSEVLKTKAACKIQILDFFPVEEQEKNNPGHYSQAFVALCESVKTNGVIEDLALRSMKVGSRGNGDAQALAQALASNRTLTKLDVSYNEIGDDGCTALADALKVNTALTHVNFRNNHFCYAGAKALAEILPFNTTLRFMDLAFNGIKEEGARALGTAWGSMADQNLTISLERADSDDNCESDSDSDLTEEMHIVAVGARDHQVEVRRMQLLAFGMGFHHRLGGREDGGGAEQGEGQMPCPFHEMGEDIFRLIGKALAGV